MDLFNLIENHGGWVVAVTGSNVAEPQHTNLTLSFRNVLDKGVFITKLTHWPLVTLTDRRQGTTNLVLSVPLGQALLSSD